MKRLKFVKTVLKIIKNVKTYSFSERYSVIIPDDLMVGKIRFLWYSYLKNKEINYIFYKIIITQSNIY